MPSDDYFGFSLLVAGRPIPEYAHDGRVYVESNLHTPFSYSHKTEQLVNDELEIESVPVTPYQLQIRLAPHCEDSAVFVYVDGVLASKFMLQKGQSKIIGGFRDKEGIREFLFSLPRFATDESDRISSKRESHIGMVEVVRYEASYVKQEYRKTADTVFNQATKKDALKVTAGKYTMSTTKKGKLIHQIKPYDVQLKKLWRIGRESGKLTVRYRMGHTLKDMGIELRPTDWTNVVNRKTVSERCSSSSSVELQSGSPPCSPLANSPSDEHSTTESSSRTSPVPSGLQAPPTLPLPHFLQQPTVFLAQNPAGGIICFPRLLIPVKAEPEDTKPDITTLKQCT